MRELHFKNMTTWEEMKRDICVEEVVEKDGILATTTRRCIYFIKERKRIADPHDLKKIANAKVSEENPERHFHVLKERDSTHGVDKLLCKVAGTFYAMINEYLYCIAFFHTFKITFSAK